MGATLKFLHNDSNDDNNEDDLAIKIAQPFLRKRQPKILIYIQILQFTI